MTHSNEHDESNIFVQVIDELKQSGELYVEWAKIEIAQQIYSVMKRQNVTKADLARRLGKSRSYITQILQGDANLTIESLIKVSTALNCEFEFKLNKKQVEETWGAFKRNQPSCKIYPWANSNYVPATFSEDTAEVEDTDAPVPLVA